MKGKQIKFVVLGAGIALSMVFLVIVGLQGEGFSYYLTVSEYLEAGATETEGFRVNGKVVDGTILRQTSGQDVKFVMSDGTESMTVMYHGIIPDTFVDGADVVVEGEMTPDQVFQAHKLLAKCPSKYEAAEGEGAATQAAALPTEP